MQLKVIKKVEQENGNTVLTLVGVDTAMSGSLCWEIPVGIVYEIGDAIDVDILADKISVREELEIIKEVIDTLLMEVL